MHSIKLLLRYGGVKEISPADKWVVMNVFFFLNESKTKFAWDVRTK